MEERKREREEGREGRRIRSKNSKKHNHGELAKVESDTTNEEIYFVSGRINHFKMN